MGLAPIRLAAAITLALLSAVGGAVAQESARTADFLAALWRDAAARGVERVTFDAAFEAFTPDPKVIELARSQPEFNQTMGAYLSGRVSEQRIEQGRAMLARWKTVLADVERRSGVDRYTVLAVWGLETNFGAMTGGKNVVRSLATLACCTKRRPDYFREELLIALSILEAHDIDPRGMSGSWAGAMGQTQFMPSSFMKFAVDFDGDGHRNIWTSVPDALASTANYLAKQGWSPRKTWGYEVVIPKGFDFLDIDRLAGKPLSTWAAAGLTRVGGGRFPHPDDAAWLRVPAGAKGPAFLVTGNFDVLRLYNSSDAYAFSVGHLADRIRGGDPFFGRWPADPPLTREQREALQRRLTELGYPLAKIDGKIGEETRAALRAWQASAGILADGYPTVSVLRRMGAIP